MKKLFALLCVIALLGALCVPAMAATGRVAVAAQVPEDWTTVYLYAWGDAEEVAWPGVPMTLIDDWYVAYMNDNNANVIINNGSGAQTGDLAVTAGLPVCVIAIDPTNAEVDVELPIEVPAESEMPKPAMDTVYALAPESWSTAYLYAWAGGGTSTNAGWPGVEMTKGDDGLWVGELTPGFENVIITAGNEGPQTVDIPYNGGECWILLTAEPTEGPKFKANVYYEKPASIVPPEDSDIVPAPMPELGDDWYVAGTMNGWNCADEAYKMLPNGDGTFSFTMSLTTGNHALKVTNGTWDVCFGREGGTDGNYEFGMSADGEATVNFDGNGGVTVVGDNVVDVLPGLEASADRYIAGSMNEWNCKDESYKMTANGDGTYTYSFAAIPGDYSLKVTTGAWDGTEVGGEGADGNYEFNVADECGVVVKFDGTAISHEFISLDELNNQSNNNTNNDDNGGNTTGDNKIDDDKGGNTTLIISIVATVVILIGGGAAVFFVLKKKD